MSGERKDPFADVDRHWDAAMDALREHGLDPDAVVADAAAVVDAYAEHTCPSCEGDDGVASRCGKLLGAFPIHPPRVTEEHWRQARAIAAEAAATGARLKALKEKYGV